ncbi:MAG: TetR/AcrR family transcriptional regulator [Ruminococcaceae bacterium]|nr:TetR/AcrR family transcriptional regulator [Oscillospiraceae bacterium]
MARINKSALTRLEIIRVASKLFLNEGYSNTSIKMVCKELDMSPGNVTFYFATKEHLLAELVELMCKFQWRQVELEANEGVSSVLALCLELTAMATMCDDPVAMDFLHASYTSPLCLELIRRNDVERAKKVFGQYRPEWDHEQYAEAEVLVSGVEYGTLMTAGDPVSLERRVSGALHNILGIYGIPPEARETKIQTVFAMDYRNLGSRVLADFKKYVDEANEQALLDLLGR